MLRGVVDIGGREAQRCADANEDADLAAGEGEDGDETNETAPPDAADPEPPSMRTPRVYTVEEITRRKSQLMKAIDGYEAMLGRLAVTPGPVSTRLTAQTAFILQLMLYACTVDQARSDGAAELIHLAHPNHGPAFYELLDAMMPDWRSRKARLERVLS